MSESQPSHLAPAAGVHAVVLVEGTSDQGALAALAVRRGRNLEAEGVSIVAIGGAHAVGRFLDRFGPHGLGLRLAGLCDSAEEDVGAFRTLQKQPAWRGRPTEEQLRRFLGSGGSRKIRYARLLVDALDLDHVPRPLDLVLVGV